jgi:dipeptidyl aminopeptidase/acylaminoacyl peptidase
MKLILIYTLLIVSFVGSAQKNMQPETLWDFGRISDPQLSPDGKTIIYGVSTYNLEENKGITDIYSVSLDSKVGLQLSSNKFHQYNQRWFPDGSKIGYISTESGEAQIWEMKPDGSDKKQISKISGGINSFEYSPTGNNILYCKDVKLLETTIEKHPDLPKANVIMAEELMYRHWDNWSDEYFSHIFVATYIDGKIDNHKDIMPGEKWDSPLSPYFDNTEITWSPDGKSIAYTCKKMTGEAYASTTNSDIYIYELESGKTNNITKGMNGYDKYPVFSNDGKKIAWMSMETPGYEADKERLFVMDLETNEKQYITKDFDQNAGHFVWSDDDKNIYFISGINATYQIYSYNFKSEKFNQITKGHHNYTWFDKKGKTLAGSKMSMSMASELFMIDEKKGNETQLTYTNKKIYSEFEMGKVEEHWIETSDGKKMLVWLILPPGFDPNKKYPALLYCQGGPQSAVSQFFSYRWNFQMMAAHGYVVIAPNRRGLPTFGQEWNAQISGDYGGQNMKDYLSAVDHFKNEAYIDENRIGAIGASYGGFSVFWLAGNHKGRFKAFISHCGMYNLESQYAATEEMFFVNHDLGGPYWEKNNQTAQKSYANSPHKFVQNWDTPILIISGMNDFRIPYTESLQAFNAAQLVGVPSKLLIFPDETHFVLKPQNAVLWQREFFNWLDTYLK